MSKVKTKTRRTSKRKVATRRKKIEAMDIDAVDVHDNYAMMMLLLADALDQ